MTKPSHPARYFKARSIRTILNQTRTGLTNPSIYCMNVWSMDLEPVYQNIHVSLAQTVFRLAVNCDLKSDCKIKWFLWLKLLIDWRQLSESDVYRHQILTTILAVKLKVINQDRMIFGDFTVHFAPISLKFCKGHFPLKS